jgi:histidine phosphotransfer protein HptB
MAFQSGTIEASLSAALGDDPALVSDLRQAFFDGVVRHLDALDRAASDGDVRDAVARLRGLAASFGADRLMSALAPVATAGIVTPAQRRRIGRVIAMMKAH